MLRKYVHTEYLNATFNYILNQLDLLHFTIAHNYLTWLKHDIQKITKQLAMFQTSLGRLPLFFHHQTLPNLIFFV